MAKDIIKKYDRKQTKKNNNKTGRVYVIVGDGELNEGMIWEAIMFASSKKLTNICSKNGGYIYALLRHDGLIQTYEDLGYVKGDSYTHEMIKKI